MNATDGLSNTPLHLLCADENVDTIPDCISILVRETTCDKISILGLVIV